MKRKLSKHPHFEWIMKYAKEKDNVTKLFKAYATRMKRLSKEPKFKFGIQVPHNHNQAKQLDSFNKDNLWEEAEGKEIGSLEKHSTFVVLEDMNLYLKDTSKFHITLFLMLSLMVEGKQD